MTEIQNPNVQVLVIAVLNLRFICDLVLEIWDFSVWPASFRTVAITGPHNT